MTSKAYVRAVALHRHIVSMVCEQPVHAYVRRGGDGNKFFDSVLARSLHELLEHPRGDTPVRESAHAKKGCVKNAGCVRWVVGTWKGEGGG